LGILAFLLVKTARNPIMQLGTYSLKTLNLFFVCKIFGAGDIIR
jgi:hypothetical protein